MAQESYLKVGISLLLEITRNLLKVQPPTQGCVGSTFFFKNERNAVFVKIGAKRAKNHMSPGSCKKSAERIRAF